MLGPELGTAPTQSIFLQGSTVSTSTETFKQTVKPPAPSCLTLLRHGLELLSLLRQAGSAFQSTQLLSPTPVHVQEAATFTASETFSLPSRNPPGTLPSSFYHEFLRGLRLSAH